MSWEQAQPVKFTRPAEADLSDLQYHFVKAGSSGGVVTSDTVGEDCLGVLQNKPTSGKEAVIVALGISKLKVMEAIVDGEDIGTTDTTATEAEGGSADSGHYVLGKSLHGQAAVAGDIITAAINCISNHLLA